LSNGAHSIEAVDLTKTYGSFTALSHLNLKIEGAKCVGFLGPNGAGKTTTLKMFTDLIRPSSGKAMIDGVNVHTHKRQALDSVGSVIETPEIYPSLTPREALGMVVELRGVAHSERKKMIEDAVEEVRMSEWIDKRVGKFSKGMKQRIDIASALLNDPSIIILDEPTSGLDPRGMSEVRDIVKSLKNKNRLIFMSSHILSEVADVCDEVAMIDHGKLLVYDTLSNVTAKFSGGETVLEVEFSRPVSDGLLTKAIPAIPDVISAEKRDQMNLVIKYTGTAAAREQILKELVKLDAGLVGYRPASSALEETYLNLIADSK
jgi:ABC-2 type transport system ATP-binding protein